MVVPEFGPDDPAGWAVRAAMADALLRILRHDPGTRMGSVEDLHQFRVGVRRLRSDLRTLEPLLERSWGLARCRPQVTGRPAGAVRDLDVLMARMDPAHGDLATALRPMVADLRQRHTTALLDELRSDRYAQLLERLVVLARDPELSPAGRTSTGEALPTTARPASPRAADGLARLDRWRAAPGPVAAKRARYAAETAARGLEPERAEAARRFADDLGAFQDLLGRHQDAVVAADEAHAAAATKTSSWWSRPDG